VTEGVEAILAGIEERAQDGQRIVLAINKIDRVSSEALLGLSAKLNEQTDFEATFMISAEKGHGVGTLKAWLAEALPVGPWLYPEDQIADLPLRMIAAEMTREKLTLRLHQELPYQLTVETESWEEKKDGSVRVDQVIYVMRDGHKGIVLGHGGETIKAVSKASSEFWVHAYRNRLDLHNIPVFLRKRGDNTAGVVLVKLNTLDGQAKLYQRGFAFEGPRGWDVLAEGSDHDVETASVIADIFTSEHGRHAGVVRGGASRKLKPVLQPGNQVQVDWSARLEEHLGAFRVEPTKSRAVQVMGNRRALEGLNSVCALTGFCLGEREPAGGFYALTLELVDNICEADHWLSGYARWEAILLSYTLKSSPEHAVHG